jgi:iron complex transport system substrate-binding protein
LKARSGIIAFLIISLTLTTCLISESGAESAVISKDREGNNITLPKDIRRIISIGPSNTEILAAVGFADMIIAADTYSVKIEGLKGEIPFFSMMSPDGERIIDLDPDVIFVTMMSKAEGIDPFKMVADAGICIVYIPSSNNLNGIKDDIRFIAGVMGAAEKGSAIITDMEKEIDRVTKIGETITDKKSVYFEISAAPNMYSFGGGVFLNEILRLIGAENILADQESWVTVADEVVLDKNPDVILTSVDYLNDPIGEIMSRPGWSAITAVQNGDVYYINTGASNSPSHHIVKALEEMAKAVYPDKY